jgi:hypothetical protein
MAVALSVACSTTGHHTGSWWLYELAGSVVLTGIAAAGLWQARRSRARVEDGRSPPGSS